MKNATGRKVRWYVAELIVECRLGSTTRGKTLYDRQIHVLRAASDEAAYKRAMKLGKAENQSYRNSADEKVVWKFVGLGDLRELLAGRISDGTEIYSSLARGDAKARVLPKRDLTVFWAARNKHKKAEELLNSATRPSAPR